MSEKTDKDLAQHEDAFEVKAAVLIAIIQEAERRAYILPLQLLAVCVQQDKESEWDAD